MLSILTSLMKTLLRKIVVLFALSIFLTVGASETTRPRIRCKDGERTALLKFKESLYVGQNWYERNNAGIVLSNWGIDESKRECCEWIGIRCNNETGRVVALDLSPESLRLQGGTLISIKDNNQTSPSLPELRDLSYLDLSHVHFGYKSIPISVGSFAGLRYLNLSYVYLTGEVPAQLGNLSNLQVLDLSHNFLMKIGSLSWASGLSSLRLLNMRITNMIANRDWLHVVNNLPSLTYLDLYYSFLQDASELSSANTSKRLAYLDLSWNFDLTNSTLKWLFNYSPSLVHLDISFCDFESASVPEGSADMASLSYLDLSFSNIGGSIPEFLGSLNSLTYLDLHHNRFTGFIPKSLGKLTSLQHLNLGSNMLQGELSELVWEICTRFPESSSRCDNFSLVHLDLSSNRLSGDVSKSIGKLSKLEFLDLSSNSIEADMSDAHFEKLTSLSYLDLSFNKHIVLDISSDWIPTFQLEYIHLGSCKLGPRFPRWLEMQKKYVVLNVSHSGISDYIPNRFWNNLSPDELASLDLSNNELKGTIPNIIWNFSDPITHIDLSSNQLEGHVPPFLLLRVRGLNLHQNKFSDISSICNLSMRTPLEFLDISHNKLSGELPSCWSNVKNIEILILGNNKFTGEIPNSIGDMTSIRTLQLANNGFSGKLPASLEKCTSLLVFDAGGNKLTGEIPTWIGKSLQNLAILSLRSNSFLGNLHRELCQLDNLQVLDLSSNNLSREIPSCFGYFTSMRHIKGVHKPHYVKPHYARPESHGDSMEINKGEFKEKLTAQWKGSLREFENLQLLKSLDLSNNMLSGELPKELTQLIGLISLNLSRNNLKGRIPEDIGRMQSLDALDLSKNHFSGRIPSSLSQIDRLGILDLSSNNLSGKIPTGTQLQIREASAYQENPKLCGVPLPRKCPGEEDKEPTHSKPNKDSHEDQDGDDLITTGIYISAAIGYFIGFCGICSTLAFTLVFLKSSKINLYCFRK